MENPPVLPSKKKFGLKRWQLIALWLAIVTVFTLFGYFRPGNQIEASDFSVRAAVEVAVLFGGLGFGIATCGVFGLDVLSRVRYGRLRKLWAIASLAISAVASIIATPATILLARAALPWRILSGERTLAVAEISGSMVIVAAGAFVFFSFSVFCIREAVSPAD